MRILWCFALLTLSACMNRGGARLDYDVVFQNDTGVGLTWVALVDSGPELSCGVLSRGSFAVIGDCHRPLSGQPMSLEFKEDVQDNARYYSIAIPPLAEDYNGRQIHIRVVGMDKVIVELKQRPSGPR